MREEEILIPSKLLEYIDDFSEQKKDYLKSNIVRISLDHILNIVAIKFTNENISKWEKRTIHDRLNSIKYFFPSDIFNKLDHIRKYSNNGEHANLLINLTTKEIDSAMDDIKHVCEWILTSYFIKYGFTKEDWVATILSTLPPIFRIRILEPVFDDIIKNNLIDKNELNKYLCMVQNYDKKIKEVLSNMDFNKIKYINTYTPTIPLEKKYINFLLLIDKLGLAYMKNIDINKSHDFLQYCLNNNYINDQFYNEMIDKVDSLYKEIDNLKISNNLEDTRKRLKELFSNANLENDNSLFKTIFVAIVL